MSTDLQTGEYGTFTDAQTMKAAALLFDRICVVAVGTERKSLRDVPDELLFHPDEENMARDSNLSLGSRFSAVRVSRGIHLLNQDTIAALMKNYVDTYADHYARRGISIVPSFSSCELFASTLEIGDAVAYRAILSNIPVIANTVPWEQVVEFRRDEDATLKLRRMRVWVQESLKTKSVSEAEDRIATQLSDYSNALRKHGIETLLGSISTVLSLKGVSSSAIGALAVGSLGSSPVWAALAGGIALGAQAVVSIAENLLKLDHERNTADVAFINEVRAAFPVVK
jgi:Family of unknown function (DUF6236)